MASDSDDDFEPVCLDHIPEDVVPRLNSAVFLAFVPQVPKEAAGEDTSGGQAPAAAQLDGREAGGAAVNQEGAPGIKRKRSSLNQVGDRHEPEPPTCRRCKGSLAKVGATFKPKYRGNDTSTKTTVVDICCASCEQQQLVIKNGDVLWRGPPPDKLSPSTTLHIVRSFPNIGNKSTIGWHTQRLSAFLKLPSTASSTGFQEYPIFPSYVDGERRFGLLLRRSHDDLPCKQFVDDYARGIAGVLPAKSIRLFYKTDTKHDILTVPPSCPSFACCKCLCQNPWAAGGADPCHRTCRAPRAAPVELADDGSSCCYQGIKYSADDLAWVLPHDAPEVDAELALVRILRFSRPPPLLDDSQEVEVLGSSSAEEMVKLEYEPYTRSCTVQGYAYCPTGQTGSCWISRLRGLGDLARRAPGSWVVSLEASGSAGAGEGEGGTPAAGAIAHAGQAGMRPDGSGSLDATPSGSDDSAVLSWASGGPSSDTADSSGAGSGGRAGAGEADGGADVCEGEELLEARIQSSAGAGPSGRHELAVRVRACDLFCGFGGLSMGLQRANPGLRVFWAVDMFREALQTYKGCHPGAATFAMNVCEFLDGIRARKPGFPVPHKDGQDMEESEVLFGGPPCQGYSKANMGDPEEKARKNILVPLFLSVLGELNWPIGIMENVSGLLSAGDTMQHIQQAAVSMGYQCSFRLLNAGSYGSAQHRRRVIVYFARHGLPMPEWPEPTHVFPGAGGYVQGRNGQPATCTLEDRQQLAWSGVPSIWRDNVVVPNAAPLPALTAWDVIGDLPRAAGEIAHDKAPGSYYAACMRRGQMAKVGAPLHNHVTSNLQSGTLERVRSIPKADQPPPDGQERWAGACSVPEHPFRPARSGNWVDLPEDRIPDGLKGKQADKKTWGMFARLHWHAHFATILTNPALHSNTTSTIVHPEADRPLTVREAARVQGVPDDVQFVGSTADCYKQVGNAVPVPLAEALGRELRRALELAESRRAK